MQRNAARFPLTPAFSCIAVRGSQIAAPLLLLTLAGCGDTATYSDPPASERPPIKVGQNVTVEFRRDVLGAARELPVSPRTGSINNASVVVVGQVKEVRPGWILLGVDDQAGPIVDGRRTPSLCWIPLSVVLAIDVNG